MKKYILPILIILLFFGKTQKYKDGLQKICKLCVKNPSEKLSKIKEKQKKLQELKNKLDN